MPILYITEFQALGQAGLPTNGFGPNGPTQAALQPAVAEQTVAIGGTSASSAAFNAATTLVRLHTDSICSTEFGTAPVATTSTARMVAGQTEYYGVTAGSALKVAVIANT